MGCHSWWLQGSFKRSHGVDLRRSRRARPGCLAARPRSLTSREVRAESTLPNFQRPSSLNSHQAHLEMTHEPDRWALTVYSLKVVSVCSFHNDIQPFMTSQRYWKCKESLAPTVSSISKQKWKNCRSFWKVCWSPWLTWGSALLQSYKVTKGTLTTPPGGRCCCCPLRPLCSQSPSKKIEASVQSCVFVFNSRGGIYRGLQWTVFVGLESGPSTSKIQTRKYETTQEIQADVKTILSSKPLESSQSLIINNCQCLQPQCLTLFFNASVLLSLQGRDDTQSRGFRSNWSRDENQWRSWPTALQLAEAESTSALMPRPPDPPGDYRGACQRSACGFYFEAAWLASRLPSGAALLHRKRCVFASDKQA